MFEDLVSGKENSPLILVQDTVNHRGNCILNYITQGLLNRLDLVILFMLDRHSKYLNTSDRLYVYDGLSDPLGWTTSISLSSDPISKQFFFKNILTKTIKNNEKFTLFLSENSVKKVGIIINSLSAVISHQNIAIVCKDLYEVINYRTQTFEVNQTVALVHSDLHSENILSSLNCIATTCIELKDFVDKKESSGHFIITHCKKNGKLSKKSEEYKIDSDVQLTIIHTEDKNNIEVKTTSSESEDITSNLTFNLTLTEEQQQARAKLQLPYLLDDETKQAQLYLGKKSQIFYEADEADDLDEEDPDDDLNI